MDLSSCEIEWDPLQNTMNIHGFLLMFLIVSLSCEPPTLGPCSFVYED